MTSAEYLDRAYGPVVGYCDHLGYLRCVDCVGDDVPDYDSQGPAPVRAKVGPHNEEPCESCGHILGRSVAR